jgi:TolB protein
MKKTVLIGSIFCVAILLVRSKAQQTAQIPIEQHAGKPSIAVPDFRGGGAAQAYMSVFNQTLFSQLQDSASLKMAPKTVYPLRIPQQPTDFREPVNGQPQGPWLTDWSGPPVNANYLAFGYSAVQGNTLVLYGWLYRVDLPSTQGAQSIGKIYTGSLDEPGAKKVAEEFAADILKQFGATSLMGTKIFFVSDRTGSKEIWSMDYDGSNQKQITSYHSITQFPCVSADGTKVGFTTYARGTPMIFIHSLETGRKLPFYNQAASVNAASDFTPDSKQLLLYSTAAGGGYAQIYEANVDGSNLRRISHSRSIDVEPKMNPKTSAEIVFVSDRGGLPQVYRMSSDGTDVLRLTNGDGEAVNPSWNPDGQHIAFAWTKGFDPGNFNIFIMDVASREVNQLTHGEGRNENPSWAPDGTHLVYSSKRGRSTQIWTMLADGSGQKLLTSQGNNLKPVWGKASTQ